SIVFLADFFHVSVDYLLGRNVKRNPYEIIHETKEQYRIDVSDLPENAVKEVVDFVEFVKHKNNISKSK
ncbi:MAG TPA: XRE family transcriptional regulator, partial [Clostridia bacterium]|nr:XRE family transcriptional regulator [Clostridia bacterium]